MIDLLIADDHRVLRQALCEMLERDGKYRVVAQATDGVEVMELLKSHSPDLIIMDLVMPEIDGVEAIEKLKYSGKAPPVLVLSATESKGNIRAALKAGAKGYVPKNVEIRELEFAIDSILSGKTYLSPSVTESLVFADNTGSPLEDPLVQLTKREKEILKHLADGLPNREIASLLHISTRTVDTHRSNILKKLKAKTNAELVKMAIASGLTSV